MSGIPRLTYFKCSIIFINNKKTNELNSRTGEELSTTEIFFPNNLGIAGTVFQAGETIHIPHANADLRVNPSFDKKPDFLRVPFYLHLCYKKGGCDYRRNTVFK
jgi:hypothetical protein